MRCQAHTAAAGEGHRRTARGLRPAVLAEAAATSAALDESLCQWYHKEAARMRTGNEPDQDAVQRLDAMRQSMLDAADIALVSEFMCAA